MIQLKLNSRVSFRENLELLDWSTIDSYVNERHALDAVDLDRPGYGGFLRLLSPKTDDELQVMARRSARLTRERFGRVIQLYAPVYISNLCCNTCTYCGFHAGSGAVRGQLTDEEVLAEAEVLRNEGFRHILLVSGEDRTGVSPERLAALCSVLKRQWSSVALEVYPLSGDEYRLVRDGGADNVTLYQETYLPDLYATYHPRGPKSDFGTRLGVLEAAAAAGFPRVNVGALLGLGPWRSEMSRLGLHASYLAKRFWTTVVAVSMPRMREATGGIRPPHPVSDRDLLQLTLALRLFLPDSPLVLSTREPAEMRDRLATVGITQMSAGSRTEPGGYSKVQEHYEAQFHVEDSRTPGQVVDRLRELGLDPVWKDWEATF